jgi:hypothetical protein
MDIGVDSNFEGKTLPKLTSFLQNQIRKTIKKKHTLPRYKVRYKPFFVKEQPQDGKNEVNYYFLFHVSYSNIYLGIKFGSDSL